ncbi:hypothetical protein KIW84_023328 [Lathyrus oleraceus]|uniref:hAT-like transposase RNase-H fold domain-containing protein n=1 Tax=Pisum sativum TaxID=3888 RepID=A0A9D5B6B5_PEA|nr:hypothetical protein KIW84_023328 [Pisum sativum]
MAPLSEWHSFEWRIPSYTLLCHILNLTVKDGMKEVDDSIVRIRAAVRYVRRTPSRFQRFKKSTERISGSSYVTRNMYMLEVFGVGRSILNMCNSEDQKVRSMAIKMKAKYNKYWGKSDHLNMLLLIAMVLDPRCKLKLVVRMAARIYDTSDA